MRAAAALERLSLRAHASGTSWALGLEARSRALMSTGPAAEELYREAIQRLGDCRRVPDLARTHLVYGEWLRRERRRKDASEQLRTAHKLLSEMGLEAFAAHAAHELHIARLVATGATSKEVGAQLFLSPRTIDAPAQHLPQARHHLPPAAQGPAASLTRLGRRWTPTAPPAPRLDATGRPLLARTRRPPG
ncbi:hypothetical protein [Nonomuraea sp. 10N515B]|uniref:hypothetical protein n=1 Tax=Nonomuraea sp. 10N515B TaxID=3457422 RepID=UPI003FCE40AA